MDPGLFYELPLTDIHNKGLDGVFVKNLQCLEQSPI